MGLNKQLYLSIYLSKNSGKRSDPTNYRPISVIPVVAKVFERIIYDQLYHYLIKNNFLSCHQSGFRSLHSTLTALTEATDSWAMDIDRGLVNAVVFLDLKKAFDTVVHKNCNTMGFVGPAINGLLLIWIIEHRFVI